MVGIWLGAGLGRYMDIECFQGYNASILLQQLGTSVAMFGNIEIDIAESIDIAPTLLFFFCFNVWACS